MTQKGIEIDSYILGESETAKMAVNQLLQTKADYFCPKAMEGEKLKSLRRVAFAVILWKFPRRTTLSQLSKRKSSGITMNIYKLPNMKKGGKN